MEKTMKTLDRIKNMSRRKKVIAGVAAIIVLMIIAGTVIFVIRRNNTDSNEQQMISENGEIQATGVTATALITQTLEIDNLDASLVVEKLYVSAGQSVKKDETVCKLTDESYQKAKEELEREKQEAEIAYQQGKITYEEAVIDANKDASLDQINAKYADSIYEVNLTTAQNKLTSLQKQVNEAQQLVQEYTDGINNSYYQTYYQVKELQDECDKNFALLMQLYEDWDIAAQIAKAETAQSSSSGSGTEGSGAGGTGMSGSSSGESGGSGSQSGSSNEELSLYNDFAEEVSEEAAERDAAEDSCEDAVKKATYSLENAKAEYEMLKAQLTEEQISLEKETVTLKAESDTAKAEGEIADTTCQTAIKKAAETLNDTQSKYEDAQDNLEVFESLFPDGNLYAKTDGTIMAVNMNEGDSLQSQTPLVAYNDLSQITVDVSVDQAYISQINVGDEVSASISGIGRVNGSVSSIQTAESTSRSAVTYTVTVLLDSDEEQDITANLTTTVTFKSATQENKKGEKTDEEESTDKGQSTDEEQSSDEGQNTDEEQSTESVSENKNVSAKQ